MSSEKLRIPDEGYKGLEILQGLQQDSLQEFVSALNRAPLSFDREKLFTSVQKAVSKIASDDVEVLLRTIFSLHVTYRHSSRKLNIFLDDIVYAIKNSDKYSKNFLNTDWVKFHGTLENLFAIESLICLSKAVDIVAEHACIYTGSRVLTDIRPVFGVNESAISALFVSNILKLEYYEDGDERELFIALDEDDIKNLIETLQRAQGKAKAIKATIVVEKIPYIES
jgi:hypothetical protein